MAKDTADERAEAGEEVVLGQVPRHLGHSEEAEEAGDFQNAQELREPPRGAGPVAGGGDEDEVEGDGGDEVDEEPALEVSPRDASSVHHQHLVEVLEVARVKVEDEVGHEEEVDDDVEDQEAEAAVGQEGVVPVEGDLDQLDDDVP